MKFLCLGNNTELTDQQTEQLASHDNAKNHGLLSDLDHKIDLSSLFVDNGYYHTSVLDMSTGRIQLLSKYFDKVIVLDQPISLWNHPDEFYATHNVALSLGNKAGWLNNNGKQQVEYWENLVNTNESFCIFPFIELLTNNNHTTVCCRSSTPVVNINELEDFYTDKNYQQIRNHMLNGVKVPEHCKSCYKLESRKIKSARQQETVEWAIRLGLESIEDLKKITAPVYYEVRPSNVCNIMCRICYPQFSNKIEREWKSLGWVNQDKTFAYSDFDIVKIADVKKLYVAGGEPTAMPEFYRFLEKCIEQNNTDFEFLVNTNAVKISDKLLNLGKQFSNLQFVVSIDGYEKANDYSRWGSKWKTVIENAQKIKNNGHKVTFNITISLYTIFSYAQLVHYIDNTFNGCLIHSQFAENVYPFIFEYTSTQLEELMSITQTDIYQNDQLFSSFVDGVIDLAKQSKLDKEKLQHFFNFNDTLDISRNSCLNEYIPQLEQLRSLL